MNRTLINVYLLMSCSIKHQYSLRSPAINPIIPFLKDKTHYFFVSLF